MSTKDLAPENLAKIQIKIKRNKKTIDTVRTNERKFGEAIQYLKNKYQTEDRTTKI